jgi:hypothetical protein
MTVTRKDAPPGETGRDARKDVTDTLHNPRVRLSTRKRQNYTLQLRATRGNSG